MATRYSGTVTIKLAYIAETTIALSGHYRCVLSSPLTALRKPEVVTVACPAVLVDAVDSANAYDLAAHAAISFATDAIQSCADFTDHATPQWSIHRTSKERFDRSIERFDRESATKKTAARRRVEAYQALGATEGAAEQLALAGTVRLSGRCLYTDGFGPACDLTRFAPPTVRAENVLSPHAFDIFCKMVGEAIDMYQKSITNQV